MKFLNGNMYIDKLLAKIKTQEKFNDVFREFTEQIDNGSLNSFKVNSDINYLIDGLAIAQDNGDSLEDLKESFKRILFYLLKAECYIQF